MRTFASIGAIALASLSFSQAVRVPSYKGQGTDELYNRYYNPHREVKISGYVTGKVKGTPGNGAVETMSILVRDAHRRVHQVDLGPSWYVADQTTSVNVGDKVTVVGTPILIDHRERVILAREVIRKGRVLTLRSPSGYPYWVAYHRGKITVTPNSRTVSGEIVGQTTVNVENQREMAYELRTRNGLINVALAPSWYMQQQNIGFRVGDSILVYTGAGPAQFGNNIILANGIYGNDSTFVLRPNGQPVWGGFGNRVINVGN